MNADLPFIPELIQVDIHTKNNVSETEILDFEHILLKKADFQCFDALKYKVSMRDELRIVHNI